MQRPYRLYEITQNLGWPGFATITGYSVGRTSKEAVKIYAESQPREDQDRIISMEKKGTLGIKKLEIKVQGFKIEIAPKENGAAGH